MRLDDVAGNICQVPPYLAHGVEGGASQIVELPHNALRCLELLLDLNEGVNDDTQDQGPTQVPFPA